MGRLVVRRLLGGYWVATGVNISGWTGGSSLLSLGLSVGEWADHPPNQIDSLTRCSAELARPSDGGRGGRAVPRGLLCDLDWSCGSQVARRISHVE
jgi:hypothetical protein